MFGAAAALSWATLGLLWAQVILLPNPLLPPPSLAELLGDVPPSTHPQRFIVMLFKETSLLLTAFALSGLFVAALVHRGGVRKSSLVAAGLSTAAVSVSLVPVAQAWKEASTEGVSLSVPEYLAGPALAAYRSPHTVTYARPRGEELKADIWRPPGEVAYSVKGRRPPTSRVSPPWATWAAWIGS